MSDRITREVRLPVTAFAAITSAASQERTAGEPAAADEIPMLLRRRLRGPALGAVRCGLGALRSVTLPVELVSCGRHGDLHRTQRLIWGMVEGQPPSPLEFSLSVHNALAGMLDLVRGERTGHTSIAAGRHTFTAALTELWARLSCQPDRAMLLFYVEYGLPQELADQTDPGLDGTVLAALIERTAAVPPLAELRRAPSNGAEGQDSEVEARRVLSVLQQGGTARVAGRGGFDWVVEAPA